MKTLALFNKYSYVQQYKYMPTIMETLNTVLPPIVLYKLYMPTIMETLNTVLPPIVLYKLFALWIKYSISTM